MLTDRRTDGRTDDGRKVITIAHPEHSSGELTRPVARQDSSLELVLINEIKNHDLKILKS